MHVSKIGDLLTTRWNENLVRSIEMKRLFKISSAIARPAAGDCCNPCPENPLHNKRFEKSEWWPIIAF